MYLTLGTPDTLALFLPSLSTSHKVPFLSLTNNLPFGKKAIPQGTLNPPIKLSTTKTSFFVVSNELSQFCGSLAAIISVKRNKININNIFRLVLAINFRSTFITEKRIAI